MKSEVEFGDYPVRIIPLCQIPRSIVVDFPMRLSIHQQLRKSVKTIMDVIFPSYLLSVDLVSHFYATGLSIFSENKRKLLVF